MQNFRQTGTFIALIGIFTLIVWMCKDNITNTISLENNLCYKKQHNNKWEIFTNNITGTNPKNISNYSGNDEYPQWSPNGRYIVYSRSISINGPLIIVYDLKNNAENNLTSDGGGASQRPQWLPNSIVCFGYPFYWAKYKGTYIVKPYESQKRKILNTIPTEIFFYPDSYNFIYTIDYTKVYKSNIDNTFNEYLFDIKQNLNQDLAIQGFNPYTEELLISPKINDSIDAIATYNINTNDLKILLSGEIGYDFGQIRYSKDYTKIACVEIETASKKDEDYLSVYENGEKRRLVRFTGDEWFDYSPLEFSYNGRYIAFSKNVTQRDTGWYWWKSYLYVVNTITGELHYIDEGRYPSWNPNTY